MTLSKQDCLDIIIEEPVKIGHWVGFEDLEDIHNEWIKSFLFAEEDETLLAHRGSYKTTCLSIAIALMIVIYPKLSIIFLRKTDTDIIEIVKQVAKILRSEIMCEIIKSIYGFDLEFIVESGSEINTNLNSSSRGTSQLIGLGIGASMTGKHGDIIITDDIVNSKDRSSKAERDRTKAAYMELQNVKNRGGRITNTGTPWHKEDAISTMPNVKRFSCHETGLMTTAQINKLREVMTPSLFAANYELKHIADADSMFSNPNYEEDSSLIYDGISHIDASYGGADGTAYTIIKKIGENFYVLGKHWKKHVDDCENEIMLLQEQYRVGTIRCERNGDKGYLAKNLENRGAIVNTYHEKENKFIKISTYLRRYWSNIYFLNETDEDYINEVLDYTENAEHDDSPDSLASLLRYLIKNQHESIDVTETINIFKQYGL
ncbi:MAG: hypothetical protein RR439_03765 [Carnobacterium sp.]